MELAERSDRLAATAIDVAVYVPLMLAAFVFANSRSASFAAVLGVSGLGMAALLFYQWYLLATLGQTIGKRQMGIKIVLVKDLSNGGFVANVLLRVFAAGALKAVPVVGGIVTIADALFIFRDDRRCIHDHIAGTCVIKA